MRPWARRWTIGLALAAATGASCTGSPRGGGAPADVSVRPNFHADVAPILRARCEGCHREGGLGPFPLITYASARDHAAAMVTRVTARTMPPWAAEATDDCAPRLPFASDPHLGDEEIALVARWVELGSPEGAAVPDELPAPREPTLDDATHTFAIPSPHTILPGASDDVRCFVIDPSLDEDTAFDATSVVPGNARVVHHASVYADPTRSVLARAPIGGDFPCFGSGGIADAHLVANWTPGAGPLFLQDGVALVVPKGALLIMQVHYHSRPDGAETDATSVLLRRAKTPPVWLAEPRFNGNASGFEPAGYPIQLLAGPDDPPEGPRFFIPAGAKGHVETMVVTIPSAMSDGTPMPERRIGAVSAHMHWRGTDMQIRVGRATPQDDEPKVECLLDTPRYDFDWQRLYRYAAPVEALPTIRPGDQIELRCVFDNSLDNPCVSAALTAQGEKHAYDVSLGESTNDEMCTAIIVFYRQTP